MMKKLRYLLLMMLCAVVTGAWAETKSVTISPSQALNDGGVDPITIVCAKGDGTSNPAISSSQLRLYQAGNGKTTGNTITFSSDKLITSIVFTFASNMTADNGSFSVGTYDSSSYTWSGSTNEVTLTVTGTSSSTRIYITEMVVYYEEAAVSENSTSITIDDSGITNTNVFTGTAAGSLSATVNDKDGNAIDGASVTWSSDDADVATIDASTGAVTLVGAGSTVITASYEGDETNYKPSSATYELTVTNSDPNAPVEKWVLVAPEDLQTGDIVAIVDQTSSTAMDNYGGASSAPDAKAVILNTDKDEIISEVASTIQWVVTVSEETTKSFQFGVANTEDFLYCTNSNNGVRVGTNANNVFTIYDNNGTNFLLNSGTNRYLGVYNNQDWRCYTSINKNIQDCVTKLYKKVVELPDITLTDDSDSDNSSIISANDGQKVNATVSRTLSPNYYNTLFLPFDMTADQITEAFGEGAQVATFTGMLSETQFGFGNVTAIEANVPYLVKPTKDVNGFTVEGVTINNTTKDATVDGGYGMVGNYDTYTNGSSSSGGGFVIGGLGGSSSSNDIYYFTTSGTIKKLSSGGSIKGLRAFMVKLPSGKTSVETVVSNAGISFGGGGSGPSRANSQDFVLGLEDDNSTTAINKVDTAVDANAPVYNLAGQRVGQSYKGVVIQNGKKFVIK